METRINDAVITTAVTFLWKW